MYEHTKSFLGFLNKTRYHNLSKIGQGSLQGENIIEKAKMDISTNDVLKDAIIVIYLFFMRMQRVYVDLYTNHLE